MSHNNQSRNSIIIRLNLILKVGMPFKKWHKYMKNSKQRYNILKEWQATQKSYIQDLLIIENNIQRPLKAAKIITQQQQRLLFPNIKAMIDLSQSLHKCIEDTIKTWDPIETMIGQNIMVFYKFFMIYREYCNNFMKSQQIVKTWKNIPQALKIQDKLKLDFQSYTIKPVQRPPKYQLLLRQYHKSLTKSHKDYKLVEAAIEKYHQVNQLNNQSMDRQIRAEIMIKLHKKYGNIISNRTGRQYLKQFNCRSLQLKCILYAFNDMVLIIKKKEKEGDDNDQVYKRLRLDGTSYIAYKKHFKYYSNMVFICGVNKTIHLQFDTPADTQYFYEEIQNIINRLYHRQQQRKIRFNQNEVKRRNLRKFRVSKWYDDSVCKVTYKPKLQIKVVTTIKPNQVFYAIQFKIIYPYSISQTIMLTYHNVVQLYDHLKNKFKNFQYTKLTHIPEHIGLIEAAKNRAKIIEYRSFVIEEFLNVIFRNQDFYYIWKDISLRVGIHPALFQFSSTQNFYCICQQCVEVKQNQSIQYYLMLLKKINSPQGVKKNVLSQIPKQDDNGYKVRSDFLMYTHYPSKSKNLEICPSYVFNILNSLRLCQKESLINFSEKMLVLQAQLGQFNFALFPIAKTPLRTTIKLKIYLLNIQQQYIQITLKQDKYVRQILHQIATTNSLQTIYDWSIYLYNDGRYIRVSNDEKILDFVNKFDFDIQKFQDSIEQQSFFGAKFENLKKWGQQFWGSKKVKIFLKKHLHFEHEIEVQACKSNKQRYHFLINEVFGRIKYENLYLSQSQTIAMCAFFLMKNEFEKIKHLSVNNLDITILKQLLPNNRYYYLQSKQFKQNIVKDVIKYYEQLQKFQNSRNAIQIIYLKILNFLRNNQQWITKYFILTTYKSDNKYDVTIGINYNYFIVKRIKDDKNILFIQLSRLKFKTSTFSLFIYQAENHYRYDGDQVGTIRNLIETYLTYCRIFSSRNST